MRMPLRGATGITVGCVQPCAATSTGVNVKRCGAVRWGREERGVRWARGLSRGRTGGDEEAACLRVLLPAPAGLRANLQARACPPLALLDLLLTWQSEDRMTRASSNAKYWPRQLRGPWMKGRNCGGWWVGRWGWVGCQRWGASGATGLALGAAQATQHRAEQVSKQGREQRAESRAGQGKQGAHVVGPQVFGQLLVLAAWHEALRPEGQRLLVLVVDPLRGGR